MRAGLNLEATLAVEANAPAIRALAAKLVKGQPDAWAAARAINAWVYKSVEKNYGASSDRATDVLASLTGDCTEHSLLAVALLRAAGIPARRVDGLLYLRQEDGVPAFYTQRVSAGGFPIVASARVNPYALKGAAYLVDLMLATKYYC